MEHSSILHLFYFALTITIKEVQGILDVSVPTPTYAVEYQGYHINIFKDTSVTSEPTFYYTPACFVFPNGTSVTAKKDNPQQLTIKIGLWDEEYTRHIKSYLIQRTGIQHPDIRPVPFKWMRIDTIDNWQISQIGTKWKSIANHPKVVSFRVRCLTPFSCDEMGESIVADNEHFASTVHLAFAYRLPNITKSTIAIERDHLQASHGFQTISRRYPEASFVYLQKSDFDDLVQEVLQENLMSSLLHDEFVDNEQINHLLRDYANKLLHNITSTTQFTESMWSVTFWTDESQRPDVRAKDLEALFSSGKHCLQRVMRGENVTSETGISESSPNVAEAIAELREGKGHVQLSGSGFILKPFKLWCVALGALRGDTGFEASSIWVTKRSADYLTAAHFANRNSATESLGVTVESRTDVSHYNNTFGKMLQMIAHLTDQTKQCSTTPALRSNTLETGIGISLFNRTFDKVFQMFGNLTGTVLQTRLNSASETKNATLEIKTGFSHFNQTFEQIFQMIGNLTDMYTARIHGLELSGIINATWLLRDADTLGSLNHTVIAANVRSMLDGVSAELTATTNSFGEMSLFLPKRNGFQLAVTFELAGYYPITLRNVQLDANSDAITASMEPLLFVSRRFTGSGTATGKFYDFSKNPIALQGVNLDFRADMNSHTGTVVTNVTTSADGAWNVTLPGGHYTVTASKSGYITVPFTVVIVGGKSRLYSVRGLSPILNNGEIRIVSVGGDASRSLYLCAHVRGPIEGKPERAHTKPHASHPGSLVRYAGCWAEFSSVLIEKQLAGIYRISVSDWNLIAKERTGTLWDMANSGVTVQLYTGNKLWAQYFVPDRSGNAWSVVEVNGTYLKTINEVATVTSVWDVN